MCRLRRGGDERGEVAGGFEQFRRVEVSGKVLLINVYLIGEYEHLPDLGKPDDV